MRAPSIAKPVYGRPSPRAVHSAHDWSATPHWSSPPPLVIESPKARTPRPMRSAAYAARSGGVAGALLCSPVHGEPPIHLLDVQAVAHSPAGQAGAARHLT